MFLNSDGIIGTTFDSCIISNNQAFCPKNKKKKFMREKIISNEKACMMVKNCNMPRTLEALKL